VDAALADLTAVARGSGDLLAPMLAATRLEATLGEICGALRDGFGGWTEPTAF
jgi:methylmalonyl-CoA mutase N-terminal domain/subunit